MLKLIKKCPFCRASFDNTEYIYKSWNGAFFYKCKNCELLYQKMYEEQNYESKEWKNVIDPDGKTRDLAKEIKFRQKNWYGNVIKHINTLESGKILDYGCGDGGLLSAIDNKWEKVGYETNSEKVDFIKENYPDIRIRHTSDPTHYKPQSFDVIAAYHVLEHLENPLEIFNKLYSLLKYNGHLIIGFPNPDSWTAKRFKENYRLLSKEHLTLFSDWHIKNLFQAHNLVITNIECPFFRTKYFSIKNLWRLWNIKKVSPPFYGNIVTYYARKLEMGERVFIS